MCNSVTEGQSLHEAALAMNWNSLANFYVGFISEKKLLVVGSVSTIGFWGGGQSVQLPALKDAWMKRYSILQPNIVLSKQNKQDSASREAHMSDIPAQAHVTAQACRTIIEGHMCLCLVIYHVDEQEQQDGVNFLRQTCAQSLNARQWRQHKSSHL